MSLDKAIEHRKEKRKQYRGIKYCSAICRNNGGCPYCESNRTHDKIKKESFSCDDLE